MKLTTKFILASLAMALIPLAGAGVRLVTNMDRTLREGAWRLQAHLAQHTAEGLRAQTDGMINLFSFVKGMATDLRFPSGTLESLLNTCPPVTDVWIYNAEGKETTTLHRFRPSEGIDPALWPRVRETLSQRGYYAGAAEFSDKTLPSRMLVLPLKNSSLRTVGFLAARLDLAFLSEALRGLDLGVGGRVYVLDGDLRLIAYSGGDRELRRRFSPVPEWRGEKGSLGEYRGMDGTPVLGAKSILSESGWVVIVEQPSSAALAAVNEARRRILWTLMGAGLTAVFLAFIVGRLVVRPLRLFRSVVDKMEGGRFDSLIDFESGDEMGDIARALRRAQPALEKRVRDSLLGKLARFIGHDMRTPIQGLRLALDTVARHVQGADDVAVKQFQVCFEALDWIDDFLEDLLTVGRDRQPTLRRASVNTLVQGLLPRFKVKENVRFSWVGAVDLPPVMLDEKEVKKAIANIVKNALEAMGEKGSVDISTRREKDGVVLSVKDSGPGLPEEKKSRLFEEWTNKETGTGLGLLVVKKVMDQHRGTIVVESLPGQGTTFHLYLPPGDQTDKSSSSAK